MAENLLNRDFTAQRPNEKWVTDITYIQTEEGWLYLAGVLDLYGRRLVGWAMDSRMKTELVSRRPLSRQSAGPALRPASWFIPIAAFNTPAKHISGC